MIKKLAKITKAGLNIKDMGILTFEIHVDFEDGWSMMIGGLALDGYDEEKDKRIGTAYGCEMIRRLLLLFDVNNINEIENKIIWVYGKGEGNMFATKGISRLKVDSKESPLMFSEIYKEFYNEEEIND